MRDHLFIGPSQRHYNLKRDWLENRFEAIVEEILREGKQGRPIDELCKEGAEVACWLGEEITRKVKV